MGLFQYEAGSCMPRTMNVHALAAGFTEASTVYTNRPAARTDGTEMATTTENRGGTGCTTGTISDGFIHADVTAMVKKWAAGSYTNYGMRLNVPGEY